jgi:hypothetical protein
VHPSKRRSPVGEGRETDGERTKGHEEEFAFTPASYTGGFGVSFGIDLLR